MQLFRHFRSVRPGPISTGLLIAAIVAGPVPVAAPLHADEAPAPQKRRMKMNLSAASVTKIPIERARGIIILPATIGAKSINVLFDNGAGATLIDGQLAREAGWSLKPLEIRARTVGGDVMSTQLAGSAAVDGAEPGAPLLIGDTLRISGEVLAMDLAPMSQALGVRIHAVLGDDALHALLAVINPEEGWLAFGRHGHLVTTMKGAGKKDDASVKVLAKQLMPQVLSFGPDYAIEARIDGHPVRLKIDYGKNGGVSLHPSVWEKVMDDDARTGETTASTGMSGRSVTSPFGRADLEVGPFLARDVPIASLEGIPGTNYDGLLGLAVLASRPTLLNRSKKQLVIWPKEGTLDVAAKEPDS